jgi:hypothetical protein
MLQFPTFLQPCYGNFKIEINVGNLLKHGMGKDTASKSMGEWEGVMTGATTVKKTAQSSHGSFLKK